MTDVVNNPTSGEPIDSRTFSERAQDWVNEKPEYSHFRGMGVEVVQRDIDGKPLSPRESALLEWFKKERTSTLAQYPEDMRDLFTDYDNNQALSEKLGTILANPTSSNGHLAVLARLSDERPPEPQA